MALVKYVPTRMELLCDGDHAQGSPRGCDRRLMVDAATPRAARSLARGRGWKYTRWNGRMYDFCPAHAWKYRH